MRVGFNRWNECMMKRSGSVVILFVFLLLKLLLLLVTDAILLLELFLLLSHDLGIAASSDSYLSLFLKKSDF